MKPFLTFCLLGLSICLLSASVVAQDEEDSVSWWDSLVNWFYSVWYGISTFTTWILSTLGDVVSDFFYNIFGIGDDSLTALAEQYLNNSYELTISGEHLVQQGQEIVDWVESIYDDLTSGNPADILNAVDVVSEVGLEALTVGKNLIDKVEELTLLLTNATGLAQSSDYVQEQLQDLLEELLVTENDLLNAKTALDEVGDLVEDILENPITIVFKLDTTYDAAEAAMVALQALGDTLIDLAKELIEAGVTYGLAWLGDQIIDSIGK